MNNKEKLYLSKLASDQRIDKLNAMPGSGHLMDPARSALPARGSKAYRALPKGLRQEVLNKSDTAHTEEYFNPTFSVPPERRGWIAGGGSRTSTKGGLSSIPNKPEPLRHAGSSTIDPGDRMRRQSAWQENRAGREAAGLPILDPWPNSWATKHTKRLLRERNGPE